MLRIQYAKEMKWNPVEMECNFNGQENETERKEMNRKKIQVVE